MKIENKFLFFYLSTITILFFLVIVINYFVDPLNIFSEQGSNEYNLAKILSQNGNIVWEDVDERKFVLNRINLESTKLKPEAIVVGSSRVMQLSSKTLDRNILNLGVSGASLEDLVTLIDQATTKFKPNTLIIGVDPWIFNARSNQDRWQVLTPEYREALSNLRLKTPGYSFDRKKYEQLIGYAYTKKSIDYLYQHFFEDNIQKVDNLNSDTPLMDRDVIRRDGSRVYNLSTANKTEGFIAANIGVWLDYSMTDYEYSAEREEIFKSFLKHYKENYSIFLLLSPYHPMVYREFQSKRPILIEVEDAVRKIAKQENIEVLGSYNPIEIGCTSMEFHDGSHPKEICMKKIVDSTRH